MERIEIANVSNSYSTPRIEPNNEISQGFFVKNRRNWICDTSIRPTLYFPSHKETKLFSSSPKKEAFLLSRWIFRYISHSFRVEMHPASPQIPLHQIPKAPPKRFFFIDFETLVYVFGWLSTLFNLCRLIVSSIRMLSLTRGDWHASGIAFASTIFPFPYLYI